MLAKDLSSQKPSHELRVSSQGKAIAEIRFYVPDLQAAEMKAVITGYDFVFKVSRDFFETIFVPATPPSPDAVTAGGVKN